MKERLTAYRRMMVEIEIEEQRRDALEGETGFSARRGRHLIEARLSSLLEAEAREHDALAAIIDAIPYPEQRQVLYARYVDGHAWCFCARLLFGRRPDFEEKAESYERRVYRIHGEALANANRIAAELGQTSDKPVSSHNRRVRASRVRRRYERSRKGAGRARGRFRAR